jgi:hypothetical protein
MARSRKQPRTEEADHVSVRLAAFIAAAALTVPGTVLAAPASTDATGCGSGANGSPGYAYAGRQDTRIAHGVRATITALSLPTVIAGHVAAWVGVGGRGDGPRGSDEWLQAGIATLAEGPPLVYAEIARAGGAPTFLSLLEDVQVGQSHRIGVLEIKGRPSWWRIWLDGAPATAPIHLSGSSGRWKPIATAESSTGGARVCNSFAFRFADVGVAAALGGSWQVFTPGYRFLDRGYRLDQLRPVPTQTRASATDAIGPYAFDARSVG